MDLVRGRWLVVGTLGALVAFGGSAWAMGELTGPTGWALVLANSLPLLLVARNPVVVVLVFAVSYPLWLEAPGAAVGREGHFLQSLPTLLALYAAGAWPRALWLRALALVTPAWMLMAAATGYWPTEIDEVVYIVLVFVIVWGFGVVDASRRVYAGQLEARTSELEQARHALADRAVSEERSRIARELHDVVAHAMSVITVQAGVGGHLIGLRPQRAAEALSIIERTGREALAELRRMLVVLRRDGPQSSGPPQPGLSELGQLFGDARDRGLRLTVEQTGPTPTLPPGVNLAIYRTVQECLTNAAKHAPGSRVDVSLGYAADEVRLVVRDHGPGPDPDSTIVRGQGLTGMAERVALYDGTLRLEPAVPGLRVCAAFPVEPGGGPT